MDELTQYLKLTEYNELKLEQILNKKIIITKDHIDNINVNYCCIYQIDIINLFEKYGYVFTNDDYIMLINNCGMIIMYISKDKRTDKICEIAVRKRSSTLRFVPEDKKTEEICKIAVQKFGDALRYVPDDKKTNEICKMAVENDFYALNFVPDNKKYLFIKNENHNI